MLKSRMLVTLIIISSLGFIFYGLLCLLTDHMKVEFERYGLSPYRQLTGALELLGGAGLLIGHYISPLLILSASGLALLMFLGILVRLKVKDALVQILPAFLLMLVNLGILFLEVAGY